MFKHTQAFCRLLLTIRSSVFDHFVRAEFAIVMVMLFYTLPKVYSEVVKISKHHILRINRLHSAILS